MSRNSSTSSLNSSSAFSSRIPSMIAFTNHPGSIHIKLSESEEDILKHFFANQSRGSSISSFSSSRNKSVPKSISIPKSVPKTEPKKESRLEKMRKKVSFKFK